jgi:hypothetical protein
MHALGPAFPMSRQSGSKRAHEGIVCEGMGCEGLACEGLACEGLACDIRADRVGANYRPGFRLTVWSAEDRDRQALIAKPSSPFPPW